MFFKEKELDFGKRKHIDYNKVEQIFYDNIYFEDSNTVLKLPLISLLKRISYEEIKIEKFDLSKYVYLIPYE